VESPDDKRRSDLIDLVESQKSGKILTGTLQGVERSPDNPDHITAVLYHGDFKIIIPVEEAVEPPKDFRGRNHGDVLHYLLSKRLGAEVDFIVKGVDAENCIAAASRLDAMALKRRQYYGGSKPALHEGATAEARITCVIRAGAFVDLFGVETYIPLRELSYQRWMDAAQHYQPGQRVLVKLLGIERTDDSVHVEASVKQVGENPYETALKRFTVGNQYVGSVSMVDTTGVFVSLDGGIDCLCTFPRRGRPPRGSRVTVRIRGINFEANRIWGAITHMTAF
jgi:ribosomal protein S1